MKYLLDSNTFIEAKNRYYGMSFCPGFWSWIQSEYLQQNIASIESVFEELKRGDDELADWALDNSQLFLPVSDHHTQACFGEIASLVASEAPKYKEGAVELFMSGADPWLIAKAKTLNAVVATHEAFNLETKKKVLIPNVCRSVGVSFIDTFALLNLLEAKFVLE